ncbi:Hansenula MRAKII killer toxin-resistant protein 1 [Actinoplanes oblitus]|uniref:Hansenula MRAKII killer toxin-resistant protein 1 n=1 Tax=Actinoplanes oblitus TaxID=3040509 RepID=A0ABY8WFG0_9ACTN|nr:Hansenula MRAKII killer toxin-resistant protein 1 [Actinoplanes oblitus]WIM96594.1 Hansenula MRAKII killer toxin-resistant protein 1 [Actinoplanes oblitus]
MADKGWTAQTAAAAGTAAGAGAAQLGLGYGLGVIEWPATTAAADSTWLNSLGWATWITASATVLGAVIAGRLRPDRPGRWRLLWRLALAASAGLGALVSVALVALPARSAAPAHHLFSHSPQLVAVGYALIGLLIGMVVAFWAVSSAPVAANLLGTAAWLWALAIAGVVAELTSGRDLDTYLTSWQFTETGAATTYGGIYWPSALLTLTAAFLIGLIAAWPATRRGDRGLGTATSGAVGPLLVALAFLALAPLLTKATGPLQSAYLIAPYAVLAGLGGSALIVALGGTGRSRAGATPSTSPPELGPAPAARPDDSASAAVAAKPADRVVPKPAPAPETPGAEPASPPAEPAEPGGRRGWALFGKRRADESVAATVVAAPAPRKPRPKKAEPAGAAFDPELAAAARPAKSPAKRAAAGKDTTARSTITPPPANPPVARINPED